HLSGSLVRRGHVELYSRRQRLSRSMVGYYQSEAGRRTPNPPVVPHKPGLQRREIRDLDGRLGTKILRAPCNCAADHEKQTESEGKPATHRRILLRRMR